MKLREAMSGYMMDAQIAEQSARYILLKKQRLSYFVDWCEKQGVTELELITSNVIRGFIIHLQGLKAHELNTHRPTLDKPLSPLTIKGYRTIVDAFFVWCKKEGFLGGRDVPTKSIPRQKIPEYIKKTFTSEQMKAMIDSCDLSTPLGFRDYVMLLLLIDTGARVSELCGLKVADIHEHYIVVFGKGKKEREIGMSPATEQALWRYLHQFRSTLVKSDQEEHVFIGRSGRPFLRYGMYQALERIGMSAGIEDIRLNPHRFRHTFAFSWLENGGDVFKLSRVLGHSELQTTQEYLKFFQSKEARVEHSHFSPISQLHLGKKVQSNQAKKKKDKKDK